jgi:hypothetical protein
MKSLEEHLNKCYLERDREYVFVYKLIKVNEKYGLRCHEAQKKPAEVWVYEDFPDGLDPDPGTGLNFLESFIPELNPECTAKVISEGHYYEVITEIEKMFEIQEEVKQQINQFVKENGLG